MFHSDSTHIVSVSSLTYLDKYSNVGLPLEGSWELILSSLFSFHSFDTIENDSQAQKYDSGGRKTANIGWIKQSLKETDLLPVH